MEALAEDAATLAAEEHRLKRELREVQRESAQKAGELAALHRRREALIAERGDGEQAQSALRTEHGEADVKLEQLRRPAASAQAHPADDLARERRTF